MRWLLLGLLLGCAHAHTPAAQIAIVDASAVARCRQVGVIEERIESPNDSETLESELMTAVRAQAAKAGATHLVVAKREIDPQYGDVRAEAFQCER